MHAYHAACCFSEVFELLKPCCEKWYQLGIKFGLKRRDLHTMIPFGLPTDAETYLNLMLKMRFDKEKFTWEELVMVLASLAAKPYS